MRFWRACDPPSRAASPSRPSSSRAWPTVPAWPPRSGACCTGTCLPLGTTYEDRAWATAQAWRAEARSAFWSTGDAASLADASWSDWTRLTGTGRLRWWSSEPPWSRPGVASRSSPRCFDPTRPPTGSRGPQPTEDLAVVTARARLRHVSVRLSRGAIPRRALDRAASRLPPGRRRLRRQLRGRRRPGVARGRGARERAGA